MDKNNKYTILTDGITQEEINESIENRNKHQELVGDVPKEILKRLGKFSREVTKIQIDDMRTARCYDKGNLLHNDDGPAVTRENGEYEHFIHGKLHNEEGPALFINGEYFHYLNGAYIPVANYEREVQRIQQHKIEIKETQALYERKDQERRDREKRQQHLLKLQNARQKKEREEKAKKERRLRKIREAKAKEEREERKKNREIEEYQDLQEEFAQQHQDLQEEFAQQRRDKLNKDAREAREKKELEARFDASQETAKDINTSMREASDETDQAMNELLKAIQNWQPELTQPNEEVLTLNDHVNMIKETETQIKAAQENVYELMEAIEPQLAEYVAEIFYHSLQPSCTSTYDIETARVSTKTFKLSDSNDKGFLFKDTYDANRMDLFLSYEYITNPQEREKWYDKTEKNLKQIKDKELKKYQEEIEVLQDKLRQAKSELKKATQWTS
jgi:hypothetical protein